jgi:hypothetical protein
MTMKMTKIRFVQAALLLVTALGARTAAAAWAWSPNVLVQKVDLESAATNGGAATAANLYLMFNTPPHTTQCSSTSGYWAIVGDADMVKAILTTATAAKMSGASVKVLFNNSYSGTESCTGGAKTGYPLLRGLEIQ